MYSTKSFCNVLAFASNEPGVVSPIGELTTFAKTFTKELGVYHHSTLESYDLLNFSSVDNSVKEAMSQTNVDQAIALVDEVVRKTLGTSGELFYDEVLQAVQAKAETLNANTVAIGKMVNAGAWWVPEWISFTDANTGAGDNTHKVWLSLSAFGLQYTDYEIVIVPPFDDLDEFFNPGSLVESRVKAITPTQMMERMEAAKAGFPETVARVDAYEYRDPVNTSRRFDVYWPALIYGPAGNDPDVLRDTLASYILANSEHTRDEWALIFPDIFKRTEFIFAPLYDQYAAEQTAFKQGVYSPIVDHAKPVNWLKTYAEGYAEAHIVANAQVMGFPMRSLQVAVIGHIENRDGKVKISQHYPDFINVGTESTDFGRMTVATQAWAMVMMDLLALAETMDASTDMPTGTYRLVRGTRTYVAKSYERVLLVVLAKHNVP